MFLVEKMILLVHIDFVKSLRSPCKNFLENGYFFLLQTGGGAYTSEAFLVSGQGAFWYKRGFLVQIWFFFACTRSYT